MSSWENNENKIWNIVTDSVGVIKQVEIVVIDDSMQYFDLWGGTKLPVINKKVVVPVERFGCVLGIKNTPSIAISTLLKKQKMETLTNLLSKDDYWKSFSAKPAKTPPQIISTKTKIPSNLLLVKGGDFDLVTKHFKREGGCFPDADGKNNNDYKVETNAFGKELIVHHTLIKTEGFKIMPQIVSNGEFEVFVKATGYKPIDNVNFLKHWKGKVCPDSIKNKAVVYVSLDDARAYAKWAGMRLPTEWEWQLAGENNSDDFIFNEVWEWNESERFDGHNHFVSLRGGCASWTLQTSDWYFPGTPNNKKPGGKQPLNSHCKYYVMKAGYDRAETLGFRCIK